MLVLGVSGKVGSDGEIHATYFTLVRSCISVAGVHVHPYCMASAELFVTDRTFEVLCARVYPLVLLQVIYSSK